MNICNNYVNDSCQMQSGIERQNCEFYKELKPCPFCGGEAVYIGTGNNYPKEYWRVICKKCFASGVYNETKGRARRRWNRRVNNG